jgi:alpha-amylase
VTFVSNHDSFWQPGGRFAEQADDDQVIAAMGFLLCALGTPCIYYGDEQGLAGAGGDNQMRQALFDEAGNKSLLNTQCRIYQEIAKIADVMRSQEPLRFGRMYYRQISGNDQNFGFPFGSAYTLAFSRILYPQEVLVAYNVSDQARHDAIVVDSALHPEPATMSYLYGGVGTVPVQTAADGTRYIHLDLTPHQFAILH